MPSSDYQITFDYADPNTTARFWAEPLHYDLEGPPQPHETWKAYWLGVGVLGDEVGDGYDSIIDPAGNRPRIWFQQVPEAESVKNRLHFDLLVGGARKVPLAARIERVQGSRSPRCVGSKRPCCDGQQRVQSLCHRDIRSRGQRVRRA
jgi:hypothetical protein